MTTHCQQVEDEFETSAPQQTLTETPSRGGNLLIFFWNSTFPGQPVVVTSQESEEVVVDMADNEEDGGAAGEDEDEEDDEARDRHPDKQQDNLG